MPHCLFTAQAIEHAFKNETVGLVTREQFVEKRLTIEDRLKEEDKRQRHEAEEEEARVSCAAAHAGQIRHAKRRAAHAWERVPLGSQLPLTEPQRAVLHLLLQEKDRQRAKKAKREQKNKLSFDDFGDEEEEEEEEQEEAAAAAAAALAGAPPAAVAAAEGEQQQGAQVGRRLGGGGNMEEGQQYGRRAPTCSYRNCYTSHPCRPPSLPASSHPPRPAQRMPALPLLALMRRPSAAGMPSWGRTPTCAPTFFPTRTGRRRRTR